MTVTETYLRFKCNIPMWKWQFKHWLFSWNVDSEGDIVFSIAKRIHCVKYKQSTLFVFGKTDYEEAPKYIRGE